MGLAINPKDTNTFASACLDQTVKIWNLGSGRANQTLEAHEVKGVNHVDYNPAADKPYLITTSDDKTVKVWDYTTKSLIATLEGHTSNVFFACYHPELPVIISGSEDGTTKIWHANTYRLKQNLSYGLERAWCVSYQRGQQRVAVGFDYGGRPSEYITADDLNLSLLTDEGLTIPNMDSNMLGLDFDLDTHDLLANPLDLDIAPSGESLSLVTASCPPSLACTSVGATLSPLPIRLSSSPYNHRNAAALSLQLQLCSCSSFVSAQGSSCS